MERQNTKLEQLSFAYQSANSLLHNIPDRAGVLFRPIYEENALTPEELPLNVEAEMLSGIMHVVQERGLGTGLLFEPYWDECLRYTPIEVLGATIQSVDLHDAPLPKTVLPPGEDVDTFINEIKALPEKATIVRQFELALDITGNNLLGAANLAWISTRLMARGADRRAYPNIHVDGAAIRDWNSRLVQFETYNKSGKNDAPGDTYYFWTHMFGAMAFSDHGLEAKIGQLAFSRGTQIMAFVRKHIARKQPNITAHQPASALGRELGLALSSLDQLSIQPATDSSSNSRNKYEKSLPVSVEYDDRATELITNDSPRIVKASLDDSMLVE